MAASVAAPPPTSEERLRAAMSRFVDARGLVNASERELREAQGRLEAALDELAVSTDCVQGLLSAQKWQGDSNAR